MKQKQLLFYLAVILLFLFQVLPGLVTHGMFMDGLLYASIARQLSHNMGSFWHLHLTDTLAPQFFGHPPLAIFLESLFFRCLGDSIYVERCYSLCTALVTGGVMVLIWKQLMPKKYQSLAWISLFFLIIIPRITWSVQANLLENTMMMFVVLSVFFMLKSLNKQRILYLILAGLMLAMGYLSKGFVALFPLTFFAWVAVFRREWKVQRLLVDSLLLMVALLIPFVCIYLFSPDGWLYLHNYLYQQVLGSIEGVKVVSSRFFILKRLLSQHIPALIFLAVFYFIAWKKKWNINACAENKSWIYIFLGLGLSGVIPIMISLKQRGFYSVPAYPFFSIVLGMLIVPLVYVWVQQIKWEGRGVQFFKASLALFFVVNMLIGVLKFGTIGRDKPMVEDVNTLIQVIPEHEVIAIPAANWRQWNLHGYLSRYHYISLDEGINKMHHFLLLPQGVNNPITSHYKKIELPLKLYDLYELK